MVEMIRFDVSVTCVSPGLPSRTCKMEVLAPSWADAARTGINRAGPAERMCLIVSKQKTKKEHAA